MNSFITPVFHVQKPLPKEFEVLPKTHIPNIHIKSIKVVDPWTFYVVIHGLILTPLNLGEPSYGFKSKAKADDARQRCTNRITEMLDNTGVWIVFKPYDDYRGPAIVDKICRNPEGLHEYILSKLGWVNPATTDFSMDNSIYHTIFYSNYYNNGYSFKFIPYSD